MAAQVLERLHIAPDSPGPDGAAGTCVETELAAVLPFDLPAYRASRAPEFRADFDRQAERCAYILVADGRYAKPDPDTPLAQRRRQRGYRAQSALLLRLADLLIAGRRKGLWQRSSNNVMGGGQSPSVSALGGHDAICTAVR